MSTLKLRIREALKSYPGASFRVLAHHARCTPDEVEAYLDRLPTKGEYTRKKVGIKLRRFIFARDGDQCSQCHGGGHNNLMNPLTIDHFFL